MLNENRSWNHLQQICYRLSTTYCQRQYELVEQLNIWRLSALDWLWVSVNTHARSSCSLLLMLEVCVSWDHTPPAATGTQLVCPSPQSHCSLSQPVRVWKITLSSSSNNSCLGKTYWRFIKQAFVLRSAVCYVLEGGPSRLTKGAGLSWNCLCGILPAEWVRGIQNLVSSNLCRLMIPR